MNNTIIFTFNNKVLSVPELGSSFKSKNPEFRRILYI